MNALLRQRLLVFLVPLALAAPFLNRAYFVDDSYFVEIAHWLAENPKLPYHFRTDDAGLQNRGWEENGFVRMVNPLAHQYYLALLLKLFGSAEWVLRLGCTLLSCFAALFIFEFARRWTNSPLLATMLVLVTPAHWLTSYSLLIDGTMAFFAFGAIYFFIRATEADSHAALFLSGVFGGLAILSKYPAVFVCPLMVSWLAMRWRKLARPWKFTVPVVVSLSFLLVYSVWTAHLYGRPHIVAASQRMLHVFGWPKLFIFFVFLSGSFVLPTMVWRVARMRTVGLALILGILVAIVMASPAGGFSILQAALLGLWLSTSLVFLSTFIALRRDWIYPRDYFLAAWLFGFIAMMLMVMDWVAVRYYCLVGPAVVFAVIRIFEIKCGDAASRYLKVALGVMFFFTSALAYSDYKQAEPSRLLVAQLKAQGFSGGPRHFYLGDSFTMSYLRSEGWIPCFPETTFEVGDLVLAKQVTMPLVWFARKPVKFREVGRFDYPSSFPLKVMDFSGSAGFYASVWGALPFTFSKGPWERFYIFEVVSVEKDVAR